MLLKLEPEGKWDMKAEILLWLRNEVSPSATRENPSSQSFGDNLHAAPNRTLLRKFAGKISWILRFSIAFITNFCSAKNQMNFDEDFISRVTGPNATKIDTLSSKNCFLSEVKA